MTKPSRRTMLAALAAAPISGVPMLAGAALISSHPDAELLRLGEEFERCHAASRPVGAECKRLEGLFKEEWDRRNNGNGSFVAWGNNRFVNNNRVAAWLKLRDEMGVDAAVEADNMALDLVDAVTKKIRETPAETFAGLAVKARALRFDAHLDTQCDLPPKDQDWPESVMDQFIAEIDRLAAGIAPIFSPFEGRTA